MKLKQIRESFLSNKIREIQQTEPLFKRPGIKSTPLYDAERGFDSGSRATSSVSQTTGVPFKRRQRKFFNMSIGPEEMMVQ